MKLSPILSIFVLVGAVAGCTTSKPEMMGNMNKKLDQAPFYLPNAEASRVVSVMTTGMSLPFDPPA
jgi:hypothetical protein